MYLVPMVVEQTNRRKSIRYIFSFAKGSYCFSGQCHDDQVANLIVAQLLFLEVRTPIKILIFTLIVREVLLPPGWQSMIQCNTSGLMYLLSV